MTGAEINARVVALATQGIRPRDIAEQLCLTAHIVGRIISKARKAGETIPYFNTHGEVVPQDSRPASPTARVEVAMDAIDDLEAPARKRGVSPVELARRIVETVVEHDLVNAVLDDGVR